MACFTKIQQRNGTSCEFKKIRNIVVSNSLGKRHLNYVWTQYVIKARTPGCVRNDNETHSIGVTGFAGRAIQWHSLLRLTVISYTPVRSRYSIHCLADQWPADCDDDVSGVCLSKWTNQLQGGLNRVWRNHGKGSINLIPSTKPYSTTNRYDFHWYVWMKLHLCFFAKQPLPLLLIILCCCKLLSGKLNFMHCHSVITFHSNDTDRNP